MTAVIPFSRYNEEFSSLVSQTRQTLSAITTILDEHDYDSESQSPPSTPTSSESKNTLQQKLNLAQQLLHQTKDLLKQMTIESRSLKSSSSNSEQDIEECNKILRIAKANHANLKDDVNAIQTRVNHYLLLSDNNSSNKRNKRNNGANSEIKEHLLSTNQSMSKQNSTLERSKQIMADTEMVAMEITEELGRNRETIESAHSRVRGVNSLSNHARRLLVNMSRRETQQKMAVYAVGVVLFLALLFLLGFF